MSALIPPLLEAYARAQFGLVTRRQALESLTPSALQRRIASGLLVPVAKGVYRLAGAGSSWRQRAMASCLAVGEPVAVSHLAAAYLWQVRSVSAPHVQLTLPPWRRSTRLRPTAHRLPLPPADVTSRWAIPVTTPVRTVIDLSTLVAEPLLERIVDDLVRSRHLQVGQVAARMASSNPLPRHRAEIVGEILARRLDRGVGASAPEDWIVDTVLAAGLQLPERNLLVEAGGKLYELDLAYPRHKIAIEYDGWEVHGDRRHFHSDREKLTALQLDGWLVLTVTSSWSAQDLVARLSTAIEQRRQMPQGEDW